MTDLITPNTPANGGQIPTYHERIDADPGFIGVRSKEHMFDYLLAEIADLRASLAAPAIPTVDRNAAIMRQALIDMQNPIIAMQREVPEGSVLNPHIAMQMASEPEWYKRHAQEALDKCATPATVKTAEKS